MPAQPSQVAEDERLILTIAGIAALGALAGSAGLFWPRIVTYLVKFGVLAAPGPAVLVPAPGAAGAGFDLARLLIGSGLLIALLACASSVLYHWLVRRAAE